MADQVEIRKWVGERRTKEMREHSYVLLNEPYEATLKIVRDDILDDNLGTYTAVTIPQFATAAKKHPDRLIVEKIFDANPTCHDGRPFFDTAHPTFAPPGKDQTFSNDFTADLPVDDLEAAANAIDTVLTSMMTIPGENGEVLDCFTGTDIALVVAPQKRRLAKRLAESETIPVTAASSSTGLTSIQNDLAGMITPIVIPELAASPDVWYLADLSKPLKPFIWQVRSSPVLRSFDSAQEWEAFNKNVYTWGLDGSDGGSYRVNAGVSLPFLMARSDPNT
jgi:phage major head subunit gpT-like protein